MTVQSTHKLAWFYFKFRVPADWEITSYSVEERVGRLEFSTRHGFQAMVAWEPCAREPDRETTMRAFLQKQVPEASAREGHGPALHTLVVGDFLVGHQQDALPCQALHYMADRKKLIRWVFGSSGEGVIENVATPILQSFERNTGAILEYAIFGLDFRLPEEFKIEDMAVLPANVMMAFESVRKARVTIRRWGLPEVVLAGRSLPDFYAWFLTAQRCRVTKTEPASFRGMEAVRAAYRQRPEHKMDRFMGRPWKNGQAWLWHNRDEQRLCAFEQIGPARVPPLDIGRVFA